MKPIHKDCDLWQFVKDMREDVKKYKRESKHNKRMGHLLSAALDLQDANMLEWTADELEYYLRNGKHR